MSDTLTAEEIDRQMQSATVPYVLREVADQAKRVPELEAELCRYEAEVARLRDALVVALAHIDAALAAVGVKVE